MKKISLLKVYIAIHVAMTIAVYFVASTQNFSFSIIKVAPFIVLGALFEFLRLDVISLKTQKIEISAGTAIVLAAIILFNPLEIAIFATIYGLIIVLYPFTKDPLKIVFNISETVNVTFFSYLVWTLLSDVHESLFSLSNILPAIFTMIIFVVVDFFAVSIIIALASNSKFKSIWSESLDWVLVSYCLMAFWGLIISVAYSSYGVYGLIVCTIPLLVMRYNMMLFSKEKEKQVSQLRGFTEKLKANNEQLIKTLSQVVDARDNSLYGHSEQVAEYAVAIARKLNLDKDSIDRLRKGAMLHDIGKLSISETILQKPSKLTNVEYEIIKQHTSLGSNLVTSMQGLSDIAAIIEEHHEFYNGQGYPSGKQKEDILIEARIISLCDTVDVMLSKRPYKNKSSASEVIEEIKRCSGIQFDPLVVNAFLEIYENDGDGFKVKH